MPCHSDRVRRNYEWRWWDPHRDGGWRRPSETDAEQLQRRAAVLRPADGVTANVIEGELHDDAWGV